MCVCVCEFVFKDARNLGSPDCGPIRVHLADEVVVGGYQMVRHFCDGRSRLTGLKTVEEPSLSRQQVEETVYKWIY